LQDTPVTRPWQHPDTYSGLHLYVIRLPAGALKTSHREVFERLRAEGIGVNLHYIPVYRQPYYEKMGFDPVDFPASERYYAEAITLPIYPGLTEDQQRDVVKRLLTPSGYQTLF
jgi:dTDP-4-amino-4,6-dideoxygalactose transaminase